MVMKKFLFLIFSFFIFLPVAYATDYTDYNNTFYITIPSNTFDFTSVIDRNGNTIQDLLDDFMPLTSNTYYRVITLGYDINNKIYQWGLTLYPKNTYSSLDVTFNGQVLSSYNTFWLYKANDFRVPNFGSMFIYNSSYQFQDYLTSSNYINMKNCYTNNTNCSYSTTRPNSSIGDVPNFSINSDYSINVSQYSGNLIYYSDIPLVLSNDIHCSSSANCYFKNVVINGRSFNVGDTLITYSNPYNYKSYDSNNFTNILVGNITDLYNFRLNLQFDYDNYNMINGMSPYFYVYGRKYHDDNNTDYYSYERLDSCVAINNHKLDKTLENGHAIFNYFSQGIYCSNVDLTQYNSFYIQLQTFSNSSGSYNISNLQYDISSGNFTIENGNYHIYETFNNLPYDFSFLVTSNEVNSSVYYRSNNRYVVGCAINLSNKNISQICTNPYDIGTTTNLGYMVYNMQQYNHDTSNVELFIDEDSIVSFGSSGSNQNSSFTYYDSSGNIETSIINNKLVLGSDTDEYDVSYYFNKVNDFISDLTNDINSFSNVIQDFYDSAPVLMKTFLYVTFILLCSYFVYLMIRK